MSFKKANFQAIGGQSKRGIGGAPQVFSYKTDDAHATVDVAGYFNEVRTNLEIGDIIFVTVVTNLDAANETFSTYGTHAVIDKSATAVDVTNVTVGTATDSR
jgi:hypothetical protein